MIFFRELRNYFFSWITVIIMLLSMLFAFVLSGRYYFREESFYNVFPSYFLLFILNVIIMGFFIYLVNKSFKDDFDKSLILLILTRPVKRSSYLLSKLLAIFVYIAIAIFLSFTSAIPVFFITYPSSSFTVSFIIALAIKMYFISLLFYFFFSVFLLFLYILLKKPLIATVVSGIVSFLMYVSMFFSGQAEKVFNILSFVFPLKQIVLLYLHISAIPEEFLFINIYDVFSKAYFNFNPFLFFISFFVIIFFMIFISFSLFQNRDIA